MSLVILITHMQICFNFFQDFCFTAIVAIFWLSASAAWANGVINMKYAANPNNWLFEEGDSICERQDGNFVVTSVTGCDIKYTGNYKKANISIVSKINRFQDRKRKIIVIKFRFHITFKIFILGHGTRFFSLGVASNPIYGK